MKWTGINIVRKIPRKNYDKNVIIMSYAVRLFEIVIPKIFPSVSSKLSCFFLKRKMTQKYHTFFSVAGKP